MKKIVTPCKCAICDTRKNERGRLVQGCWITLDPYGSAVTLYMDEDAAMYARLNLHAENTHVLVDEGGMIVCAECFEKTIPDNVETKEKLLKWMS